MIIRCIDFETTGFPPRAGVCEVGWTDISLTETGELMSQTTAMLCNPGMAIGKQAEAVHGISNEDVAGAPSAALVFKQVVIGADVFCAHNCEFERNFFTGGNVPWLCTYKVALRLHPDLPTHKCGDIPKHLGIDLDPDRCAPLHRAGPDTYVTAMILIRLLETASVSEMIEITSQPRTLTRMPFGKHKGTPIKELPTPYMRWAAQNMDAADVRNAISAELAMRGAS